MILTLQFYLKKKEFHVYVPVHSSQLLGEIDPVVELSWNKIQQSTFDGVEIELRQLWLVLSDKLLW